LWRFVLGIEVEIRRLPFTISVRLPSMSYAGKVWLGGAVLAAGLAGALACYLWPKRVMRVPLDIPMPLSVGHIETPEFATSMSSQYRIAIHFYGEGVPLEKLDCQIGMNISDAQACREIPEVLSVSWTLVGDERPVAHGSSRQLRGAGYSYHDVDRYIGIFDARAGEKYRLHINVLQDGTELAAAKPHLTVEPNLNGFEFQLMLLGLLFWVSLFCAAAGVVVLVVARRRRRAEELVSELRL
jgi:hypothetical protein